MKKALLLPLFILAVTLPGKRCEAQEVIDFDTLFWRPHVSGSLRFGEAIAPGSHIDLRSDLGMDRGEWASRWQAGFHQGNIRIGARYEAASFEGTKTLGSSLTFGRKRLGLARRLLEFLFS